MMKFQSTISILKEHKGFLLRIAIFVVIAFILLRSCIASSQDSLPPEVHAKIDKQYVNCVDVKDSTFQGGDQPERECSSITTEVVGKGVVPPQEQEKGVTEAICYRAKYENPYFWAQSHTQYEEIDFASRTSSKVAVLQNDKWAIFPDHEIQDHERWNAFSCPGEYLTEETR